MTISRFDELKITRLPTEEELNYRDIAAAGEVLSINALERYLVDLERRIKRLEKAAAEHGLTHR